MPIARQQVDAFIQRLHDTRLLEGVDRRLRVELVLEELGIPDEPEALRALLSPIVARNRDEQARFVEAFDTFFLPAATETSVTTRLPSGKYLPPGVTDDGGFRWTRKHGAIAAAATVALAVAAFLYFRTPTSAPVPSVVDTAAVARGLDRSRVARDSAPGDTLMDAGPGLPAGLDSAALAPRAGRVDSVGAGSIVVVLVGLALLLVRSMLAARRRRRISRTSDAQRRATPPFVWTPRPRQPLLFVSSEFFDAARIAQRRQPAPGFRVSIERSVAATIASGGMPSIRYERASRPPEYLLLIERLGPGDHQALLFDALVQRLGQEGIYIERFFFERDPRMCSSEKHGRMTLAELEQRFRDHRLVILGASDGLLDDEAATLAPWTAAFEGWAERAILTPVPMAAWGAREDALAALFAVLPASAVGLRAIVEGFELESTPDMRWWRESYGSDRRLPRDPAADLPGLRAALGEDVWRWLCACAVYPDLHWALTLYLGALPQLGGGARMLSEDRLLRLGSLPWFREGFIPPALRVQLLDGMSRRTERVVREAILAVLGEAPPVPESAAGRWHQAQVLVQRVLIEPDDPATRAQLREQLQTLPRSLLLRDPAARRRLRDIRRSRVERLLPRAVRRVMFRDGISLFGTRPWARRSAGAAALVALFVVPPMFYGGPPAPPPPAATAWFSTANRLQIVRGDTITLRATLHSPRDSLVNALVRWSAPASPLLRMDSTGLASATPPAGVRAQRSASLPDSVQVRVAAGGRAASFPVVVVDALPGGFRAMVDAPRKEIEVGQSRVLPPPIAVRLDGDVGAVICDPLIATLDDSLNVVGHSAGTTTLIVRNANHVETRQLTVVATAVTDRVVLERPAEFDPRTGQMTAQARGELLLKGKILAGDRALRLRSAPLVLGDTFSVALAAFAESEALRLMRGGGATDVQVTRRAGIDNVAEANGLKLCRRPFQGYIGFAVYRDTSPAAALPRVAAAGNTRPVRAAAPVTPRRTAPRAAPTVTGVAPTVTGVATSSYGGRLTDSAAAPNQIRPPVNQNVQSPVQANAQRATSQTEAPAYADVRQQIRQQQVIEPASIVASKSTDSSWSSTFGRMPDNSYAFVRTADMEGPGGMLDSLVRIAGVARSATDFEIHRIHGAAYLLAFVDQSTARMLTADAYTGKDLPQVSALGTSMRPCAIEIPLERFAPLAGSAQPEGSITLSPRSSAAGSAPRAVVHYGSGCSRPVLSK